MQSLRNRLNGNSQEVLDFIQTYGVFAGMTKYNVRDYSAIRRWLKDETGNENFGLNPKINSCPGEDAFDKLARALIRRIAEVQTENKDLKEENSLLKAELNCWGKTDELKALSVLEMVTEL